MLVRQNRLEDVQDGHRGTQDGMGGVRDEKVVVALEVDGNYAVETR